MKKIKLFFEHLPLTILIIFIYIFIINELNFNYIAGILFFGWLIDCDHLVDYFYFLIKHKKKPLIEKFLTGSYFKENNLVIIPGHSIELSLFIFFLGLIFDDIGLLFISIAHFLHLMQDLYYNKVNFFGYSLIFRIKNKFLLSMICKN